jgi:hypothetical protein
MRRINHHKIKPQQRNTARNIRVRKRQQGAEKVFWHFGRAGQCVFDGLAEVVRLEQGGGAVGLHFDRESNNKDESDVKSRLRRKE